jgi:hypothetical protein
MERLFGVRQSDSGDTLRDESSLAVVHSRRRTDFNIAKDVTFLDSHHSKTGHCKVSGHIEIGRGLYTLEVDMIAAKSVETGNWDTNGRYLR